MHNIFLGLVASKGAGGYVHVLTSMLKLISMSTRACVRIACARGCVCVCAYVYAYVCARVCKALVELRNWTQVGYRVIVSACT
jgi:hypothetical protein